MKDKAKRMKKPSTVSCKTVDKGCPGTCKTVVKGCPICGDLREPVAEFGDWPRCPGCGTC